LSQCIFAFYGSVSTNGPPYDTLLYNVIDGSDSDPVAMNWMYGGAWRVAYNYANNFSGFIERTLNSYHDNAVYNFVDNGHANVMESVGPDIAGPSNSYAIYNNIWGNIYANPAVNSNVGFWPWRPQMVVVPHSGSAGTGYVTGDVITIVQSGGSGSTWTVTASGGSVTALDQKLPGTGYTVANGLSTTGGTGTGLLVDITTANSTLYWFNNIVYGMGPAEFFNAGSQNNAQGTMELFNNVFQFIHRTDGGTDNFSCSSHTPPYSSPMVNYNNPPMTWPTSQECTGLTALVFTPTQTAN
jgi:hypothetical protein